MLSRVLAEMSDGRVLAAIRLPLRAGLPPAFAVGGEEGSIAGMPERALRHLFQEPECLAEGRGRFPPISTRRDSPPPSYIPTYLQREVPAAVARNHVRRKNGSGESHVMVLGAAGGLETAGVGLKTGRLASNPCLPHSKMLLSFAHHPAHRILRTSSCHPNTCTSPSAQPCP
jgi:hypothetical protein